MRGVNKAIIVGNLGKDPELRYLPSGGAVANISVATSEAWKDKNTGQQQEQTEWHRVVFYGKLAEIAGEYLKKGSKVYIEGSIHYRKWQDKQTGQDKYSTEIKASTMQMLDSRSSGGGFDGGQQDGGFGGGNDFAGGGFGGAPASRNDYARTQNGDAPMPQGNDLDDDIPF